MNFIDLVAQQDRIKDKLNANIQKVLAHGQYILGPEVHELEEKLAEYTGAKYCITCANGTDALQIAQMAFGSPHVLRLWSIGQRDSLHPIHDLRGFRSIICQPHGLLSVVDFC